MAAEAYSAIAHSKNVIDLDKKEKKNLIPTKLIYFR